MKKNKPKIKETLENVEELMTDQTQNKYTLRLYITGTTSRSITALTNLKKICEDYLEGQYDLEVIDLYKNPGLAKGDQIIAAPTLIKQLPEPIRRIIGDMSNKEKVLLGLDLREIKRK